MGMTDIARRGLLGALAVGLAARPVAALAGTGSPTAGSGTLPASPPAGPMPAPEPWPGGPVRELAEGVWLLPGALAAPSPANGGAVGNLLLLAPPAGPVMVGTGGSHALARRALAFARERFGRPVVLALIPQPRPEFIMGTGACREAGVPVMALARAAELIGLRCHVCLENLRRDVGPPGSDGTELVLPDLTGTPQALAASPWWRATGLRPWFPPVGHTGADLVVIDPGRGLVATGSLASRAREPELVAADTLAYLEALDAAVAARVERGASLDEAQREVRLPAFRAWVGQGV